MVLKFHSYIRLTILGIIDVFYPMFKSIMPLQTFRYAACGGGNTLLDIAIFIIMHDFVLKAQPVFLGTLQISPHIFAFMVSFCFTFPIGFYLNRYVVFQQVTSGKRSQLIKYFGVVMFCLVLNYGFMKIFVELFKWGAKLAKIFTTFFIIGFSYMSQKHFTFKLDDGTELIQ
jgi:putative flippase GtrA